VPYRDVPGEAEPGIRDGASVATESELAPWLTGRTTVYLVGRHHPVDWTLAERSRLAELCRSASIETLTTDGPFVLVHHAPAGRRGRDCADGPPAPTG
jgi:hypothetical protein